MRRAAYWGYSGRSAEIAEGPSLTPSGHSEDRNAAGQHSAAVLRGVLSYRSEAPSAPPRFQISWPAAR